MTFRYAARMGKTPRSFIREILKVTENPEIISFAGGIPNPGLIQVEEIAKATRSVFESGGAAALQYAATEGYLPLREFIAGRYRQRLGLEVVPEEILITSGSQQALDLIGKIVLDPGDAVAIERPGYLGAIQAFSLYEPHFCPVPLEEDGPDLAALERVLEEQDVRLFYGVPNSQNPSGITWSRQKREEVASLLEGTGTLFVEDDAYGELRFSGRAMPPVKRYLPDSTILTGSFSKVAAPGLRVGWICAGPEILERLVVAKQASDLHSSTLDQRILARYLLDTDVDAHVRDICRVYGRHCALMAALIDDLFPEDVVRTDPDGGMFLWVTLPPGLSSMTLFERARAEQVAILPGFPFYVGGDGEHTVRLNFSNADEEKITEGMHRLARAIGAGTIGV